MSTQNAITYYQVTNFEGKIRREDWPSFPSRVVANTQRILRSLERHNAKATFFVLGYVAERHPALALEIDAAGHEIGSHSYWHRLVYDLTPDEFREDLRRSRDVLQNIVGKPVRAFRSPSFSITKRSLWALEILSEEGFTVDSSVFPIHHHRYGIPDACPQPFVYKFPAGDLWEFPISVARWGKRVNVPISGGGYFRLFPWQMTEKLLQQVNCRFAMPFVFYTHPWEFDPDQPRVKAGSRLQRFRHYVNLATTEAKFERLLKSFRFGRLDEVLAKYINTLDRSVASAAAFAS
jgi:polysaccharide deacetylase family protein (PEP-CTERM system associated)